MDVKMSFLSQMKLNSNRKLRHRLNCASRYLPPLESLGRIMFCCVDMLDIAVRRWVKEREKEKGHNIRSC